MKYYLSSYRLGNQEHKLAQLFGENQRFLAYVPNARDFTGADPVRVRREIEEDIKQLHAIGVTASVLNLKDFFGKAKELKSALSEFSGVWVGGGNTFVLRQAMKLSGFDLLLLNELVNDPEFIYSGYSAGCCVLSPTLRAFQIVDNPNDFPYEEQREQIWDGIGLLDFVFLPHFDSDHPESAAILKERDYCEANHIAYRTFRDGEVMVLE